MLDATIGLFIVVFSIISLVTKNDDVRGGCLGGMFVAGIWLAAYGFLMTFAM